MFEQKLTNLDNPDQYHMVSDQHGPIDNQVADLQERWGTANTELGPVIDLSVTALQPLLNAEWQKADAFAKSLVDRNMRELCLRIKADVAVGRISSEHPILAVIDDYDTAVSSIWGQYYQNKARILAQEPTVEYQSPVEVKTPEEFNFLIADISP